MIKIKILSPLLVSWKEQALFRVSYFTETLKVLLHFMVQFGHSIALRKKKNRIYYLFYDILKAF